MPTLVEMLEAGVHFGHKKERSHPKMKDYTFTLREGVYIIDLEKTQDCLKQAIDFLKKQVELGKTILFVGTKRQAKDLVKHTAELAGMPYIIHRWLGGTLTNFETVRKSINEIASIETQMKSPEFANFTKKERKLASDRLEKLENVFGGIRDMKNLPDVVLVVDANREKLAISEAIRVGIPVVALADTDANPEGINYLIPANDDSTKSIDLVLKQISSVLGVKKNVKPAVKENEQKEAEKIKEDK